METKADERVHAEEKIEPPPQGTQIADYCFAVNDLQISKARRRQRHYIPVANITVNGDYLLSA
ncbi:MAG TPA: hypothetical protein VN687_06795 [Blastocatellia bacterium]|nr:hypothetical protein [Blastocatellia bacterium]